MTQPDVVGNEAGGGHAFRVLAAIAVVALVVGLVIRAANHTSGETSAAPPPSPRPASSVPPTPTTSRSAAPIDVAVSFPDVVVRIGDELAEVSDDGLRHLADLPAGATDVWATTLTTSDSTADGGTSAAVGAGSPSAPVATGEHQVHVFGVHDGEAFRQDIGQAGGSESVRADIGAADRVLQTQEYPVLVRSGPPVTVASSGNGLLGDRPGQVAIPAGWSPTRFENLGYAGLLVRPADSVGDVEIATWAPGGTPQPLTRSGRLLGVTDGGQAIWLDPSCPAGIHCVLYFGDSGAVVPTYGIQAPVGTQYAPQPAAFGGGGYLAAVATYTGTAAQGSAVLVLANPYQASATTIAGSDGVMASPGMFWAQGHVLVFVADSAQTGGTPRLMRYDVDTGSSQMFGPALPAGVRLLTSYGSTSGVTALP